MGTSSGPNNFCLQWNDFAKNVSCAFKELRYESNFFDVTLACTDSGSRTFQAHKVILSACSNFFKSMFCQQANANKHPNPSHRIFIQSTHYPQMKSHNFYFNDSQAQSSRYLKV